MSAVDSPSRISWATRVAAVIASWGGAVDEDDADAQAAEQDDVLQQGAEVVVLDDGAVQGDDEDAVAEARHVAEDLAQAGPAAGCVAHRHRLPPRPLRNPR